MKDGCRVLFSSIYFLFIDDNILYFYWIDVDEVWYYYVGDFLIIYMINLDGEYMIVILGIDI